MVFAALVLVFDLLYFLTRVIETGYIHTIFVANKFKKCI